MTTMKNISVQKQGAILNMKTCVEEWNVLELTEGIQKLHLINKEIKSM